jgi:D-glycero-D-manno-heptose 1,7-bisphosphate phosphatase
VNRAVFLDRDGTLIEERGYLDRLDLVTPFPYTAGAIRQLRSAGFRIVVVTNQAGVARGFFDESFVRETHRHLDRLLAAEGAAPDAYYYCPHHPEGVVEGYRVLCRCRKPSPGMIERAAIDLNIDVARSFVVGDKWLDVGLANQAGARGILVRTGYGEATVDDLPADVRAEYIAPTLREAADYILSTDRGPAEAGHHGHE